MDLCKILTALGILVVVLFVVAVVVGMARGT